MSECIGFDARMIRHTGIGTYIQGLLSDWKDQQKSKSELRLFGKEEKIGAQYPFQVDSFDAPIYSLKEQFQYPFKVRDCKLWHAPHYNAPLFKGKTKLVVTVHDLIHWVYRDQFFSGLQKGYARFMLGSVVKRSDHVITVSEKTKQDLVEFFQADPNKVSVVYEGVRDRYKKLGDQSRVDELLTRQGIPGKYFLYVGSLKPHKNVLWLIEAFRKMKKEKCIQANLVIIGRKDKKYPAGYESLSSFTDGDGVYHRHPVSDDDLLTFYNGAVALVHPSLYEGFGLTLLESMACGSPVVANRVASIPEVVGDAACLLEPSDELSLKETLIKLETDSNFREEQSQRGLERVKEFSWKKAADQTWQVYERVLGEG